MKLSSLVLAAFVGCGGEASQADHRVVPHPPVVSTAALCSPP